MVDNLWLYLLLGLVWILIFLGVRSRRYKDRLAKIKPESPRVTLISAIIAAPLGFLVYAVLMELTGLLKNLDPKSSFGILMLMGLFTVYFIVWRLIAASMKLILKS